MISMPPPEFEIDIALAEKLIQQQASKYKRLKIEALGIGWDNVMYKLGKDKIIRLPRTRISDTLIQVEIKWLHYLASKLPLAIPATLFTGKPSDLYPCHWSIIPYYEGTTSNKSSIDEQEVLKLAKFLKTLHQLPKQEIIGSDPNGILQFKAEAIKSRIDRVKQKTDLISPKLETIISHGLNASAPRETKWIHADLHPRNVIVERNKLKAIIDWSDMTNGDVSRDLGSFWILFSDHKLIIKAFEIYGATLNEIIRSKTWAVLFGIVMLDSGMIDHPEHEAIGRDILSKMEEVN